MTQVTWDPEAMRPADAAAIEDEIHAVAAAAQVKITWVDGAWRVRALGPAALCGRGGVTAARDLSARVAEIIEDHGLPVRAR